MKIINCKWEVTVFRTTRYWRWWVTLRNDLRNCIGSYKDNFQYSSKKSATNNFKKFAKLNGIENYSIKEN